MTQTQVTAPGVYRWAYIGSPSTLFLLVIVFLLGWGFIAFSSPGSQVAAWWPAAGVSVVLIIRLHKSQRLWGVLAVLVVTTLSNIVGGREIIVAILFGVANAVEAWLVPFILSRAGRVRPLLDNLGTAYRLCASTVVGAAVIGFLAGLTIFFFDGGQLLPVWLSVAAAHATAVLIIVPFGMLPHEQLARVHSVEVFAQIAALVLVLLYVFGPGRVLPLAFLPLPIVAWAAFRFPTRIVLLEIVAIALGVSLLTTNGGGPFDQAVALGGDPSTLIQIFLLSIASFVLLATSAQNESRAITGRLTDSEEILRGGFVGSRVGLLIVERYREGFIVLESNEIASEIIAEESQTLSDRDGNSVTIWEGALAKKVQVVVRQRLDRFSWKTRQSGARSDLEVLVSPLQASAGLRYSIQFVDVSEAERTAEAQRLALRTEQIATARLTELNRQKEEFVASASHELRTPITSIIGYVELLEEEELDEFQRSSVETIARNARRLADLVESLLEIGRPRDPRTRVESSDVTQVAGDVLQSLRPVAERNGVTLTVHTEGELLVATPAIDLDRILTNLVNNAIKFTPDGGVVTLTATRTETHAAISITDSGFGMSADTIEHIFERFYRAPDAEQRGITGTGLGLPLVQGLVSKHLGTITVDSTVDEGSTFTVVLPLPPTTETDDEGPVVED